MLFSASRIYRQVTSPIKLGFFCVVLSSISFFSIANSEQQELNFKFEKFDGLYQSYAFSITQDHNGFIWIATADGLNRYDGENFKLYRHKNGKAGSISSNVIRKVFVDTRGSLWVGTDNGLNKYVAEKDQFVSFFYDDKNDKSLRDNIIWDIYEDKSGTIMVSTEKGLHKLDTEDNRFSRVYIRGIDKNFGEIKTIFQDDNKNYWLGTYANGLYLANENLSNAVSLTEANHWQLTFEDVNAVFDIKKNNKYYWIATDNGLFAVHENYELFRHFTANSLDHDLKILSNEVRAIEFYEDNKILVGTSEGLNQINLHTGEVTYQTASTHPKAINNNWLLDIFKDAVGNYWFGSYGGGLIKFNPLSKTFDHKLFSSQNTNIETVISDRKGDIWWYSESHGLNKVLGDGSFQRFNLSDNILVDKMSASPSGKLALFTDENELFIYSPQTENLDEEKDWKLTSDLNLKSPIFFDDTGIWYKTNSNALSFYSTFTKSFKKHPLPQNKKIASFYSDQDGMFWVVTTENIIYNFENETFLEYKLPRTEQTEAFITNNILVSKDWIWLSSNEDGIILIDKKSHKFKKFNESNGLANNSIVALVSDNNQNAWFSTTRAISSITASDQELINYSNDFGVEDNEYFTASVAASSSNKIYFGGTKGITEFYADDVLSIEQFVAKPIFTELLLKNKYVSINNNDAPNKTLKQQLQYSKELVLAHAQSPFSFEFVAPNPKLPSRVGYRYRLDGLEENWIETDPSNKRATYTNVSPGNYTFIVQAYDINTPSIFSENTLKVRVLPPWWLSNSAIFVYSLLVLAIIAYFLQQMRHKRLYHLQIKLSEERLKLSLWGSGDEMWDWNIKTGRIYRSNIWGILEFPQDGKRNVGTDQTNIHQQDIPRVRAALNDHFEDKTEHFESTYRVKDKNDQWIWVLDRGKIVERDDKKIPTRMTGTLKDISQIKRAEENLKLFAKCIENISDAVVIYDRQFNVVDVNKAFQRITNKSKKSMIGTALRFSNYPEHFTVAVKKHLITKGSWHGEVESQKDNNEKYLTDLNIDIIRDENKHISHFVGVFSDITKRKETEAELRRLASSDTLTGLPNRSYFQANQKRLVDSKIPHALLVFDLDNFKKINDSMGHEVGDALLCKVAQRILTIGRKQDTVYRLGGDEFSLLIENTNDIHTITSIAKEILRTIALPFKLKNQEIVLYSSIGIVLYPEDGTSPEELLKNADTAMYHAKDLGGNNYQFFNDSMNKQAVKRLQIENLIRHGLKEDYFSVFYQPKIEISTGKVAGMEALVRFETPSKGIVSPVVFIPVSEETGQIIDIGEIVLRKACHATKQWVDAGLFDGRIAVNLSAVQFTQPNLVGMIANTLKESGLAPKYLELEITEGTVMDSPQKAIDTMLQIRAMGVHLSLDDFGTGYSSLAYLKKFPLNTLKIDKAFVDDIETSEQGRNMVATIVTIAHNLDLQVVAEGVETNQQLSFLAGLRCEQLQGYLYSKPLPEPDFQKYLLSHQITDRSTSFGKI